MAPSVPLLLLPGLAGGADCWGQPFLADLRRAGANPLLYAPPRDYSFDRAVAAAAAQIERRGAPCAVLGWSMGAEVALRLALERPELVGALVLCAACADQPAQARRGAALRQLLEAPWPRWHELLMQAVMPQSLRARPAAARNFMRLTAARLFHRRGIRRRYLVCPILYCHAFLSPVMNPFSASQRAPRAVFSGTSSAKVAAGQSASALCKNAFIGMPPSPSGA